MEGKCIKVCVEVIPMQDKSESLKTKSAKHFNTKSGKSYRLEYSATFSYTDGQSETITGSTSR